MNSAPSPSVAAGRLSTHVLDTTRGQPAAGVHISLWRSSSIGWFLASEAVTNSDGRTDSPLLGGPALEAGIYELRFQIGAYFANQGQTSGRIPFLGEVVIRFGVDRPDQAYHVPLLVTPWSYSTYRGS